MSERFCPYCFGHHEKDSNDSYVIWKGRKVMPPFRCLCCGKEICGRQFAFGGCCGACDVGACQLGNRVYSKEYEHEPFDAEKYLSEYELIEEDK